MAAGVMLTVEGVLANVREGETLGASAPVLEGLKLYHSLRHHWQIALVSSTASREVIDHWLRNQGLTAHLHVLTALRGGVDDVIMRVEQLSTLRSWEMTIELLIDSNPSVVRMALRQGVIGVLFASPSYLRPEFRPDAKQSVRPWAEMEEEIREQRTMKATDPRDRDR